MKVSIIVAIDTPFELNNNFIENLLLSIHNLIYEVIIVIDGCENVRTIDYLRQKAEQNSHIKIIHLTEKVGYGVANNLAVENSRYDNLLFINNDVFPENDAIELLVKYLDDNSNNKVRVVQGLLIYPQTNRVQSTGHIFHDFYNTHALEGVSVSNELANTTQERQALTSAFYTMKRQTFIDYGGFDEYYFNAWEAMELSLKIHLNGFRCIFFPNAKAFHTRGGGRSLIAYRNDQQSAYFWSKWGLKIKNDLSTILKKQLTQELLGNIFLVINCSLIKGGEELLEELKIKTSDVIKVYPKQLNSIEFFNSLPYSIITYPSNLLFLCDTISVLSSNKRWFSLREHSDWIIDFSGNIINTKDL